MKTLGLIITIFAVIAFLGVAGSAIMYPDLYVQGIRSLFSQPQSCSITPFKSDCICTVDEEQLSVLYAGVPRYFCESTNKAFEPEAATFDTDAVNAAEARLQELYPACNMATCEREAAVQEITWGYTDNYQRRDVQVECVINGQLFSKIQMDVTTGAVNEALCGSFEEIVQETTTSNPASLTRSTQSWRYDGLIDGVEVDTYLLTAKCGDNDNGVAYATMYAPSGHLENWQVSGCTLSGGIDSSGRRTLTPATCGFDTSGTCSITESTPEYATVKCDVRCDQGAASIGDYPVAIWAQYEDAYFDNYPRCTIGTTTYQVGDTIVCNTDTTLYSCEADETWTAHGTGYKTSRSTCPA